MCKVKKYHGTSNTRIDKCMRKAIENLKYMLINSDELFKIVACCCGHGKYPMTIVVQYIGTIPTTYREIFSDVVIPRTRNFYKRDKEGYYYIPEVEEY